MPDLVHVSAEGLRCDAGGFSVDPIQPVPLAVLTHAHADHARPGSGRYVAPLGSVPILRHRLPDADVTGLPYGERVRIGDTTISFHPAGHVLGSAQLRIEAGGEVWVVSGDYKRDPDPTCPPLEPVRCDVFVTEATYALPIYRWPDSTEIAAEILAWWDACAERGIPAVLFCYALGKAQRILAELAGLTDRTVRTHGAIEAITAIYRETGVRMLPTEPVGEAKRSHAGQLVLAPPGAGGSPWMKRFSGAETGFASGWMRVRGARRRKSVDRGFVMSDHADWPGLLRTIAESGASRVLVTHGTSEPLVRFLREQGVDASGLATPFTPQEEP
jgi:putative mRNA 3-end processing factor